MWYHIPNRFILYYEAKAGKKAFKVARERNMEYENAGYVEDLK